MKRTFNVLSIIALVLTIVGAINWLLVGIFSFNFVTWATMGVVWLERAIYILVGIAGVYMFIWLCASRTMVEEDKKYETRKYTTRQNG